MEELGTVVRLEGTPRELGSTPSSLCNWPGPWKLSGVCEPFACCMPRLLSEKAYGRRTAHGAETARRLTPALVLQVTLLSWSYSYAVSINPLTWTSAISQTTGCWLASAAGGTFAVFNGVSCRIRRTRTWLCTQRSRNPLLS